MNEQKIKTQYDLKAYLLDKKQKESKTLKLEEKLQKIQTQEKEAREEIKEKSVFLQ